MGYTQSLKHTPDLPEHVRKAINLVVATSKAHEILRKKDKKLPKEYPSLHAFESTAFDKVDIKSFTPKQTEEFNKKYLEHILQLQKTESNTPLPFNAHRRDERDENDVKRPWLK